MTNRAAEPLELWRDYKGRATIEQCMEELKNDLAADGFCTQKIWATEAALLDVLFTFNLLSLYQQTTTPKVVYRQPTTLRTNVFLGDAILGRTGRQAVLHLSVAWGGPDKYKPLLQAIFHWPSSTPLKLDLPTKLSKFMRDRSAFVPFSTRCGMPVQI